MIKKPNSLEPLRNSAFLNSHTSLKTLVLLLLLLLLLRSTKKPCPQWKRWTVTSISTTTTSSSRSASKRRSASTASRRSSSKKVKAGTPPKSAMKSKFTIRGRCLMGLSLIRAAIGIALSGSRLEKQNKEKMGVRQVIKNLDAFPCAEVHLCRKLNLGLLLWDINMDSGPVATFQVHEYLRPKLCDLFENDSIFDKFDCCLSGDGLHVATGSYSNLFRVFGCAPGSAEATTLEASKNPMRRQVATPSRPSRSLGNSITRVVRRGAETSGVDANGNSFDFTTKLLQILLCSRSI